MAKGCCCVPSLCSWWETLALGPWHPSCTPGCCQTSEGRGSVSLLQSPFSSFSCFSAHLSPVELAIPAVPGALQGSAVPDHRVVLCCPRTCGDPLVSSLLTKPSAFQTFSYSGICLEVSSRFQRVPGEMGSMIPSAFPEESKPQPAQALAELFQKLEFIFVWSRDPKGSEALLPVG